MASSTLKASGVSALYVWHVQRAFYMSCQQHVQIADTCAVFVTVLYRPPGGADCGPSAALVAACVFGMQVEKLSALLGVVGTEYTCETAGYFWLLHVLSRCGHTCMDTYAVLDLGVVL